MLRFALAAASPCGRVGRGSALRSRAPESSPGRLGFRGFRSFDWLRALAIVAAFDGRGWRTGDVHPLRPGSLRSKPLPTLPRQHLSGWRKTISIIFVCFWHRWAIEAASMPAASGAACHWA